MSWKEYTDIFIINETNNPTLESKNSPFSIQFAQTRESLLDVEMYKNFLNNAINRFRNGKTYKHYKSYLMSTLGLNTCQYHSNIQSSVDGEMAKIDMHHHILTIFDIAYIITEHILNTHGCLTTFDLVELLKLEHTNHRVCTVCLCKTCHQLQHNDDNFFLPSSMGFGNWYGFLERYKFGIKKDLALKIMYLIKKEIEQSDANKNNTEELLKLRNTIMDWSVYNERFF